MFFALFSCRKTLPSEVGELNVHFGVFIGGLGDFSESYLNSVDNFRGCMSDVISQFDISFSSSSFHLNSFIFSEIVGYFNLIFLDFSV